MFLLVGQTHAADLTGDRWLMSRRQTVRVTDRWTNRQLDNTCVYAERAIYRLHCLGVDKQKHLIKKICKIESNGYLKNAVTHF